MSRDRTCRFVVRMLPSMDWTSPVSTALGAFIGVASTLAVNRVQWRRDTAKRERDELRTACVEFLSAVTQAREQILHASREGHAPTDERVRKARSALADHDVLPKRVQLHLVAPPELGEMAYATVNKLIRYRDAVAEGATHDEVEFSDVRIDFTRHRAELTQVMQRVLSSMK
ncbi:hypothetical protein CTZ27_25095 [Streptomyces griseocarneus]|nr:hypothetical protein CTZ27_25095 [Streptomyces griseocarneus]